MVGHFDEAKDLLAMVWLLAVVFLVVSLIRIAVLCVKKKARSRERERLEREGRIIFHERIDEFYPQEELERNFWEITSLASICSLIIVVGFPLINFLQNLVDWLKGLMG